MLETKRLVIGQMIVCHGCCCGATQKDRPEGAGRVAERRVAEAWPLNAVSAHSEWLRRPVRRSQRRGGEFGGGFPMAG
jgi:hypothetical protein